ncbi:hypothetical protein [Nocardia jejuensis]|uniref:hypothetical protein n=1 Tax=Nocardia jejuensis TaxID=328049 RepID=UPI000830517F|nr:hypothetical protein [Nocardia jejuensis]
MVAGLGDEDEPEDAVAETAPTGLLPMSRVRPAAIAVPITDIAHLAAAALARGETDRVIMVDLGDPPLIRTPGRVANQWLGSGVFAALPIPCVWCGWWKDGACECPPDPPLW